MRLAGEVRPRQHGVSWWKPENPETRLLSGAGLRLGEFFLLGKENVALTSIGKGFGNGSFHWGFQRKP